MGFLLWLFIVWSIHVPYRHTVFIGHICFTVVSRDLSVVLVQLTQILTGIVSQNGPPLEALDQECL